MDERTHHRILVERYLSKKATDDELAVFFKLAGEGKLDDLLEEALSGEEFAHEHPKQIRRIPLWKSIAVAASVVVLATAGLLFFFNKKTSSDTGVAIHTPSTYKKIETLRGQQRALTLPDGTKVWLNTTSTIRYPEQFASNERVVELQGECYFEVAANPSIPFLVRLKNDIQIEVLGTHFNVYAYNDEEIKATLLEGKIKIQSANYSATLHPGQEVSIQKDGQPDVKMVEMQQALAWKNGLLEFQGADVLSVMRQIERWYDVEVVFEGKIPQRQLTGKIPHNTSISDVLKILELSNVHCRLNDRTITVLQE